MSDPNDPPFKRDEFLDKPGIVGARWWHEGLVHADPVGRRIALQALLAVGGMLAASVVVSKASSCGTSKSFTTASKNALEMQKAYGWSFGAATEGLTFDGTTTQPFRPGLVSQLATDLAPSQAALRPYFVPTLLQSPSAIPSSLASDDPVPSVPLSTVLRPIFTPSMDAAYRAGKALASLFDSTVSGVAVIVDLPGPESVAFAAGAASTFDPVFAIDNWPHPRGVVAAHLTLGAAAYYQPLFAKAASSRASPAPPLFVLDRKRLTAYTDESSQFDNRHIARLPTTESLTALDVRHLLYVVPLETDIPELDDLNDDFVHGAAQGLVIKTVGVSAFGPDPSLSSTSHPVAPAGPLYYYGKSPGSHGAFWVDYPWVVPPRSGVHPPNVSLLGRDYVPSPRVTAFSGGAAAGGWRSLPANFGMVPVAVEIGTGVVLGALLSRSGSWNRSSGGWGG